MIGMATTLKQAERVVRRKHRDHYGFAFAAGMEQEMCAQHEGCSFEGNEDGRCPVCHTTWERVEACECTRCGRSRDWHLSVHEREAKVREKDARRRYAKATRQAV
jgi:formate dehydrogenase maturation protein FdhE